MEFNIDPYYDDFQQNALDNNYVRILFKPGKAVQARELTQIQSIIQNQIKQFGDHIFQDGSPVIGGNLSLDNKAKHLKLLETFNNTDIDIEDFDGKVIRNDTGTVQAKVLTTYFPTDGVPTLLVKYITGIEFADGDIVTIAGTTTKAQLIPSSANGAATICSINEGVFYVDGFFVQVPNQTAVVAPYSTIANVKIGLEISDDIVDSAIDSTLLDPAQASFNYQAPGADRYQYNLSLSTRPLDTIVDEAQFFELMRVENGAITKQVKYPIYAELEKTLARRTFDESGDYTVRPFRASIQNDADSNNYVISIEPGKAYVKGFEFETIGTLKITAPKPRTASDLKSLVDTDVDLSYGNFLYVTALRGTNSAFVNVAALEKVDIHAGYSTCVFTTQTGPSGNAFIYANTKIGTARVKNFNRYNPDLFGTNSSNVDSNGVYTLYLTDIDIKPKVLKVKSNSGNANTLNVTTLFCSNVNVFVNTTVTVLPIRLDAVANVNTANIFANSYRVNANSTVSNAFTSPNVNVGSIIRVANEVKEVVSINTAGDYLIVNTAFENTFVGTDKDANPLTIFVQRDYTQNVTGQTRTILRAGNTAGSESPGNVFFVMDRPFDNFGIADVNTVFQMNFSIDHARSFISGPVVANVLNTNANSSMNVSSLSIGRNGFTVLEDKLRNTLLFRLPARYIRRTSLNNSDYNYTKLIPLKSASPANTFTLAAGGDLASYESIPWADSTASVQDNLIVIVRDNGANTYFPNGSILQLTAANVVIGSPATQITIDTYIADISKVDILINVKQNDAEEKIRTKIFHSNTSWSGTASNFTYPTSENGNTTVTLTNFGTVANINVSQGFIFLGNTTFNSVRPGDSISLFTPDVVKLHRVLAGNTTHYPDADNVSDVTNRFYIDYGQRDDMYDHARLVLKSGYDSPNAKLLVHVDLYQHIYASGANTSFFSVDSYSDAQYENGAIPIYTSKDGTVYNLRDCLDFRPTRTLGDGGLGFTVPTIPAPDEIVELSLQYYLPRIDKLVLSKEKEFRILQGKSSPQPLPPEDVDDAMTLYTIKLPPYVADVREIKTVYNENRRFTMKDISSIEKRLQKVEFFTSLNNVENLALSDKTAYEDGTEKEKYGIVGENFRNFNIADYKSPDFNAALEGGFLIPPMNVNVFGLKRLGLTNSSQNKKTVTLQYTETPAITQGLAADKAVSVQPFLFGQFNGIMTLTPETDYWVSETLKPEVITVPERIIEVHTVTREIVKEPAPPVTIVNINQTTNVINQIITTPGDNPPPPANAEIVIVEPPAPPAPVIPPEPVIPEILPDFPWEPPSCPAPWMMIDVVGYGKIPAGELKPGMFARTYHEHTMDYGQYEVTHVESVQDAKRVQIEFEHVDFVCSVDHKFYKDGEWIAAEDLEVGDMVGFAPNEYEVLGISEFDDGEVMRITVNEAHTYVCEGILSHNKQPMPPDPEPVVVPPPAVAPTSPVVIEPSIPPDPWNEPIKFEFDPWWSIIPRNPFMYGGSFDGNSWFPYSPLPIENITTLPEAPNPTLSEPIILGSPVEDLQSSLIISPSDTVRGGGGRADLDLFDFRYMDK